MLGEEIKLPLAEAVKVPERVYFSMQFGVDKAVLRKIMHQLQKGGSWEWNDLQGDEKGALRRLAVYSRKAQDKGLLSENEADFLVQIGAGKVPPPGSVERKEFDRHLSETGIVPKKGS